MSLVVWITSGIFSMIGKSLFKGLENNFHIWSNNVVIKSVVIKSVLKYWNYCTGAYWNIVLYVHVRIAILFYMYMFVLQYCSICTCSYCNIVLYVHVRTAILYYMYMFVLQYCTICTCSYCNIVVFVHVRIAIFSCTGVYCNI